MRHSHSAIDPSYSQGFTLLEMVLVVFIMGILATVSLTFVDSQDQQWRQQETRTKADAVINAVLAQRQLGQQPLLSGFAVDNGVLPDKAGADNLRPLSDTSGWKSDSASHWVSWGPQVPISPLFSNPNPLDTPTYHLFKGLRSSYLREGIDSKGELRNGWGNPFSVTSNSSYQLDSQHPGFDTVTRTLDSDFWQVPLASLSFELFNGTDSPVSGGSPSYNRLALLVFSNNNLTAPETKWTTYYADIPAVVSHSTRSLTNLDWRYGASGDAVSTDTVVPVGEHLLIVVSGSTPSLIDNAHRRIQLYPGSLPPPISLGIAP